MVSRPDNETPSPVVRHASGRWPHCDGHFCTHRVEQVSRRAEDLLWLLSAPWNAEIMAMQRMDPLGVFSFGVEFLRREVQVMRRFLGGRLAQKDPSWRTHCRIASCMKDPSWCLVSRKLSAELPSGSGASVESEIFGFSDRTKGGDAA